jgi:transcription elongation factor GreA
MENDIYLTAEGAGRLKAELEELKGSARDALAKLLRAAIQMGDLSENADFHKAKEDQGFLEGRIQELEFTLRNAIIVEEGSVARNMVSVGTRVTVQEEDFPAETYHLVGAKEADPRNGKISNESPIGRALLDHRVGEVVEAETPGGKIELKILKIE